MLHRVVSRTETEHEAAIGFLMRIAPVHQKNIRKAAYADAIPCTPAVELSTIVVCMEAATRKKCRTSASIDGLPPERSARAPLIDCRLIDAEKSTIVRLCTQALRPLPEQSCRVPGRLPKTQRPCKSMLIIRGMPEAQPHANHRTHERTPCIPKTETTIIGRIQSTSMSPAFVPDGCSRRPFQR